MTVSVNGITLYYELHGSGEPLLLIGGLANDVHDYEMAGILEKLAEHFQVIAFDNRGVGRSDKPDIPYSIPMMADDAVALLRAINILHAHVVGVSMGGRIALDLALRYPQLVDKLVLVSTGPRVQKSLRRTLLFAFMRLLPRKMVGSQPAYAFKRQEKASSSYDCTDKLGEIKNPTLILHGTKDTLAPLSIAKEMHEKIAGSQMHTIDGGHVFFFHSKRQEFVDALVDFLA